MTNLGTSLLVGWDYSLKAFACTIFCLAAARWRSPWQVFCKVDRTVFPEAQAVKVTN
jgi:hypothetical protein